MATQPVLTPPLPATRARSHAAEVAPRSAHARSDAARRALDVLVSGMLLALLMPLLLWYGTACLLGGLQLQRAARVGRRRRLFHRYRFTSWRGRPVPGGNLPMLANVLRGDMSLVGPRAIAPDELLMHNPHAAPRFTVRPGLLGLYRLWRRMSIAYGGELEADRYYVEHRSLRGDLGIVLRSALTLLVTEKAAAAPAGQVLIQGVRIDNLSMREAIDWILQRLAAPDPSQVCFVNADCCNIARRDEAYRRVLAAAPLALADGIGMKLAGKLHRTPLRENVNGTDMFPRLCAALEGTRHGVYLLGARPGVAEEVDDWIARHFPDVKVCGWHHGYFTSEQQRQVLDDIACSGADLLLVAFGAPRQEMWIAEHLAETGVRVAIGVGGLFDFYSGRIPRAPLWIRELGLEWFYRFWQEPRRMWRRYFVGNAAFLWHNLRR